MFILVTGKPRSGKSAYAVDYMLNNRDKYHKIYSNINGLRKEGNIHLLKWSDLYDMLLECQNIYNDQIDSLGDDDVNNIDAPIIEYLLSIDFIVDNPAYVTDPKASKYLPSLFIIDEAQNHFPAKDRVTGLSAKVDPVLSWWISYHGHLYTDVILLSQNYRKIHEAYLYDIEYFLDAVRSSKSILGSASPFFKYNHHLSIPYYKTNLAGILKVKKRKEIFQAYDSGDKVRTKSVVLPWIYFLVFMSLLVFSIFYYVHDKFSRSDQDTNISTHDRNSIVVSTKPHQRHSPKYYNDIDVYSTGKRYLHLFCILTQCKNPDKSIKLNIDHLPILLKATNSQYLSSIKTGKDIADVYLLVTADFINLFKERTHDKKISGFSLIR